MREILDKNLFRNSKWEYLQSFFKKNYIFKETEGAVFIPINDSKKGVFIYHRVIHKNFLKDEVLKSKNCQDLFAQGILSFVNYRQAKKLNKTSYAKANNNKRLMLMPHRGYYWGCGEVEDGPIDRFVINDFHRNKLPEYQPKIEDIQPVINWLSKKNPNRIMDKPQTIKIENNKVPIECNKIQNVEVKLEKKEEDKIEYVLNKSKNMFILNLPEKFIKNPETGHYDDVWEVCAFFPNGHIKKEYIDKEVLESPRFKKALDDKNLEIVFLNKDDKIETISEYKLNSMSRKNIGRNRVADPNWEIENSKKLSESYNFLNKKNNIESEITNNVCKEKIYLKKDDEEIKKVQSELAKTNNDPNLTLSTRCWFDFSEPFKKKNLKKSNSPDLSKINNLSKHNKTSRLTKRKKG